MSAYQNRLGQAIGFPVENWTPPPRPSRRVLSGQYCRLEPLQAARHARELFDANRQDPEDRIWTYLPYGPYERLEQYRTWVEQMSAGDDPLFFAVRPADTGTVAGVASFLRIDPPNGVIEVGHINYAPPLQRTRAATEAMYLMMRHVFDDLGYRRYEWKCDALNAPSCAAARRLGFIYEGTFRQATIYKARNRDTAWYAIVDRDWPAVKGALETWLDPANFDSQGRQRASLSRLMQAALPPGAGAS